MVTGCLLKVETEKAEKARRHCAQDTAAPTITSRHRSPNQEAKTRARKKVLSPNQEVNCQFVCPQMVVIAIQNACKTVVSWKAKVMGRIEIKF